MVMETKVKKKKVRSMPREDMRLCTMLWLQKIFEYLV